jgi:hypothetical protein
MKWTRGGIWEHKSGGGGDRNMIELIANEPEALTRTQPSTIT